jgi:hypothetical protein
VNQLITPPLLSSSATETRSGLILQERMATTANASTTTTSTTTTASEPSRLLLDRFNGCDTVVKVDLWVNLFELVVTGREDRERLITLMRYLSGEALNWFATDIAPNVDTLTWPQTKALLIARFGTPTVHPIIAAQKRVMTRGDTVQSYYEAKMRLIRLAKQGDDVAISMLTDGMPSIYQPPLITATILTHVDWLTKALQLEAVYKRQQDVRDRRQQYATDRRPNAVAHMAETSQAFDRKRKPQRNDGKKPPTPCRFCTERGLGQHWHWHRDCPSKGQVAPPQPTTDGQPPAAVDNRPEALALDAAIGPNSANHLNWLGVRM